MKIVNKCFLILSLAFLVSTTCIAQTKVDKSNVRTLYSLMVTTGLYHPELMPNVYLFSKKEVMANSIIVFSLQ
jgi:hypothetical protein